ncbi:MAG: sodium:proton antiporter, partial [Candidatus Nealsonbacteria bacterium]|nr:sodium:proton antiporter [Candidatus Nealsonbacteria bacterium]
PMTDPLLYLTAVLGLGVAAQWLAWKARLPAILVLLIFGFALGYFAGSPDKLIDRELLFSMVSLSVGVILFEGGLSLRLSELRETGRAVLGLVTVSVLVTWVLTTVAARYVLNFTPAMAALAGAILVVSGPTVIVPLLRHVRPVRRVGSVVKWEGIVNDPIGAVLAVLVFGAVATGGLREATTVAAGQIAGTVAVGVGIAAVVAVALVQLLKRYWIPDFLHNAVFLAAVVVAFAVSNHLYHEAGLVTVTLLGVILANQKTVTVKHVVEFKENLRVLLISVLFIVLASRLKLDDLTGVGWRGPVFLAVLILVVRPAAVFLGTIRAGLHWRERLFLAWIAPRGIVAAAVASVFALRMDNAEQLVPVVFLVIVGTVAVYGLTAAPLARWLRIADPNPQGILFAGAAPFVQAIASAVQKAGYDVLLVDTGPRNIATARMAGLPTCWASVLSEYAREQIDLGGIGRLAAMTPNDVVNALAAREFAEVFGRAGVYQLAPRSADIDRQASISADRMGRVLFGSEYHYGRLAQRHAAGAVVKATKLTDEFDYDAFTDLYGRTAMVLMIIEETGALTVCAVDNPITPRAGQTLISLVDPAASVVEA